MTKWPAVRLFSSHCNECGERWCANDPYYTGHYKTREEAALTAHSRQRELMGRERLSNGQEQFDDLLRRM